MANGNPFYVKPATPDLSFFAQGLGQFLKGRRQEQQRAADETALMEAYQSRDPDAVAALIAKNPALGQQMGQMLQFRSEATERNYADTVRRLAETRDPAQRADILAERIYSVEEAGGDSTQSQQALQQLTQDPQGFEQSLELEVARTQGKPFLETYRRFRAGDPADPEFIKEERKYATQTVNSLKKRAADINKAYGKIESLVPQIKKGSRQATAAGIMSLARLISPGVVTDADFRNLTGAIDPISTALSIISGKGDTGASIVDSLQQFRDPTNPDLFDADKLLDVAKSVTAAEVPTILDELEGAKGRAGRSGMKTRQYETIFTGLKSIEDLSRFMPEEGEAPAPQAAPAYAEGTVIRNPQTGETMIMRGGQWVTQGVR